MTRREATYSNNKGSKSGFSPFLRITIILRKTNDINEIFGVLMGKKLTAKKVGTCKNGII